MKIEDVHTACRNWLDYMYGDEFLNTVYEMNSNRIDSKTWQCLMYTTNGDFFQFFVQDDYLTVCHSIKDCGEYETLSNTQVEFDEEYWPIEWRKLDA